jgi:hypothetical protein
LHLNRAIIVAIFLNRILKALNLAISRDGKEKLILFGLK